MLAFCSFGIITGISLIVLGIYGLTAPFIKELSHSTEGLTLDLEDFDKYGRKVTILGVIILIASLAGLLTCYFGQYIGMIVFSFYLTASTFLLAALIVYVGIHFSDIKSHTRGEARRMWKIAREANHWTQEIERKVSV